MQNNDKGFSLVELIVVVLIMGVLAVTLAPQAMKWVGKAEENADLRIRDNLKSVGQVSIAEYQGQGGILANANYIITSGGASVSGGTDPNTGMISLLNEYLGGDYPKVQNETGKVFQIAMDAYGKVDISVVDGTY